MTRAAIAALLMALSWTTASAQQGLRSASLPDRTPAPPPSAPSDLFLAGPFTYAPTYTPRPTRRDGLPWYAYESRTHRSDPDPIASAAPTPPRVVAPGPPKTFYVIPGCYAGDTPPRAGRLRPGCSVSNTRTIPPLVRASR